ncbi:glycoside hydrolase family 3 C-terminal domain-containing protein [Streptomyces sp. 8L]|uniref:glycoside hydrolase family 3 C-terminal domain-containing protein n=1 Tax=Streptomyces sp. 8L TaxID=2877242 RepID=UPI001CD804D8|nr:glycoside hydrolase family 3 C-terminal domain-containing protein [Streptomyces sp. 8L]MCA1221498.1 glycoside hydrolase family 3 C-terminal domain-containing protein [Streptomyces sp. 8L]
MTHTPAHVPLTLAEKASLTSGADNWTTSAVERAGILPVRLSDGPHGLRFQGGDQSDVLGLDGATAATCFPPAAALGCSWDPGLMERVGAALAAEAAALGVDVVLGPGVNIKRSPLCGRNFEYFSEDPLLAGVFGAAVVRGLQNAGTGAAVKHFAANNQETDRLRVSADIDERPLREIYLRAFERVVREARPWTVMAAYNAVNSTPACENHWLLTHVLRDEWGFDGLVMSDWGAVQDSVAAVRAGLDLRMPSTSGRSAAEVEAAVGAGQLDEEHLDRVAARAAGLSRRARRHGTPSGGPAPYEAHHALAREAAARSVVLLKNDGGLLPLDAGEDGGTVAVIGEFARTPRFQGGGSSQTTPTRVDTLLDSVRNLAGADRVHFAAGYAPAPAGGPRAAAGGHGDEAARLREAAVRAARDANTTVLFLGLPPEEETEGLDRTHLDLPEEQTALAGALAEATDRLVVVLANGGVVRVTPWSEPIPALVEGWLPGQAGGAALADVLFGVVNPSGKLTETIPHRLADTPSYLTFPGEEGHVRYGEGVFVGYRGYDARGTRVAFPFGHGLSYTDFAYDGLTVTVEPSGTPDGGSVLAQVEITNTGPVAGREIVQLYVAPPGTSQVARPERELRAFTDVTLEPGRSAWAQLRLPVRDLAYYSVREGGWRVEPGEYRFEAGSSSRDIRLDTVVVLEGDTPPVPTAESTLREWQRHPVAGPLLTAALSAAYEDDRRAARLLDDPVIRSIAEGMSLRAISEFAGSPVTGELLAELTAALSGAEAGGAVEADRDAGTAGRGSGAAPSRG